MYLISDLFRLKARLKKTFNKFICARTDHDDSEISDYFKHWMDIGQSEKVVLNKDLRS